MSTRRRFLKQAGIAGASLLLSSQSNSFFSLSRQKKVIIIGAGLAGLAAAKRLKAKNIDYIILEARKRVGGRVFSYQIDAMDDLNIELGAEWIGASHQRLLTLCDEYKLELINNQFESHLIYRGRYFKNNEWEYSPAWQKQFGLMLKNYGQMNEADKLILDGMDWWRYLVQNGCEGRDLDLRELFDSTDFGESIRHVSAYAAMAEYAESSEKNEMDFKIKGGNSKLPLMMAADVGADKIRYDCTVQKIVQSERSGGVEVTCTNGDVYKGDKIICTVPTFAAKKINWEPALSTIKIAAMNELQYARINKNPLLFSRRFWKDENFDMITDSSAHYFYHATKNQSSEKGVLISYTVGDKADVVSRQADSWRTDTVQLSLQPAFGNVKPLLEKQLNYYWGEDEYSRGSYALYAPGQWFRLMPVLKAPHLHTYFAGEHLADWQGFMEGAINSGEAAAEMV
ncbi:MAG: FAD-dependent oxidoreductase [Chitinophagaceae bacterium]|nr:MAG: FAD-dependent oxidoreductase [Chitinophagaceae bacterium]